MKSLLLASLLVVIFFIQNGQPNNSTTSTTANPQNTTTANPLNTTTDPSNSTNASTEATTTTTPKPDVKYKGQQCFSCLTVDESSPCFTGDEEGMNVMGGGLTECRTPDEPSDDTYGTVQKCFLIKGNGWVKRGCINIVEAVKQYYPKDSSKLAHGGCNKTNSMNADCKIFQFNATYNTSTDDQNQKHHKIVVKRLAIHDKGFFKGSGCNVINETEICFCSGSLCNDAPPTEGVPFLSLISLVSALLLINYSWKIIDSIS